MLFSANSVFPVFFGRSLDAPSIARGPSSRSLDMFGRLQFYLETNEHGDGKDEEEV